MVLTPIMFLATGINPAQFIHAPIQTRRTAKNFKKITKYLALQSTCYYICPSYYRIVCREFC